MPAACVQKRECLRFSHYGLFPSLHHRLWCDSLRNNHRFWLKKLLSFFFFFPNRTRTELGSRGWQPEGNSKEAFFH